MALLVMAIIAVAGLTLYGFWEVVLRGHRVGPGRQWRPRSGPGTRGALGPAMLFPNADVVVNPVLLALLGVIVGTMAGSSVWAAAS